MQTIACMMGTGIATILFLSLLHFQENVLLKRQIEASMTGKGAQSELEGKTGSQYVSNLR